MSLPALTADFIETIWNNHEDRKQIKHIQRFVYNMAGKKQGKKLRIKTILECLEKHPHETEKLLKIKRLFYKNDAVFILEMLMTCLTRRRRFGLIKPAISLTQKIKGIKKKTPLVSVIMATRNRASMLTQAIESIGKQTWTHWQLIIIDDASHDDTPEILRAYSQKDKRIQYHRFEHQQGLAVARNVAINHAKGILIALQDDDDLSRPTRLAEQVAFFKENPDIHLIGTWLEILNERGRFFETHWTSRANKPPPLSLRAKMPLLSPCLMGYRYVFTTIPMRPFFCLCEDYDFLLRCIERYNLSHIPKALYLYRHKDPSHQTMTTQSEVKILKYHFAAWLSAYYRAKKRPDPIEQDKDIDTILSEGRSLIQNADKETKDILFHHYCVNHAKNIWQKTTTTEMTPFLQWSRSMMTKKDFAQFLMHVTLDNKKTATVLAMSKKFCTDYKSFVPNRSSFQKVPKNVKKSLLYHHGIDHAKKIWKRKRKHDMAILLQWLSSITTKDIYANFLMRFTMDCRKNETTFAIITRLCTDYQDYVPTDALIFTAKKIMRQQIYRQDKTAFLLWVSFLAQPHILKISPTILWTCVWKRQFGFIPPFLQALNKKR